jgi:hypothetical protein
MLRNGYDVFLTYSNYGCREIRMRLPNGLPFEKSVWSKYISTEGLTWSADKSGKAGILCLAPYLEEAYDPVWEFDDYLDATAKLRETLIAGDPRALYVLWLCNAVSSNDDDEAVIEPPVPHGLGDLSGEAADLLAFFEADPLLVDAAAIGTPAFSAQGSQGDAVNAWLTKLADARRGEIIQRMLSEDPVALEAELLSEIRDSQQTPSWPVEPPTRTVAQLLQMCARRRTTVKTDRGAASITSSLRGLVECPKCGRRLSIGTDVKQIDRLCKQVTTYSALKVMFLT